MASIEQEEWQDIAAAIRADLAKRCELLPAMRPDEVGHLIIAVDNAMEAELKASTFDAAIEERARTLEREAAYGG